MKVNTKILSIPPYISTSWKNILSLHIDTKKEKPILVVGLANGSTIEIPNLDQESLQSVFSAHEKHLNPKTPPLSEPEPSSSFGESFSERSSAILSLPINFGLGNGMENLLQHNPEAANSPPLPEEFIKKIAHLSKMLGFENLANLSKPEPHCNCTHCQIMSILQNEKPNQHYQEALDGEEVSDEDLRFREWNIEQTGDNLYRVSNPFNAEEYFNVFLGKPVGCTCGKENCEHIRAVLHS